MSMISCKRASELISKAADEPLGRIEAFQLKLHLFVCDFCVQFRRNIQILRSAVRARRDDSPGAGQLDSGSESAQTNAGFKERLKESVKKCIEKR